MWVKNKFLVTSKFLLFPQCFQKACFPGASKGVIVWEWVKQLLRYSKVSPNVLILYHTIQTFKDPEKEAFLHSLWEKEKMVVTSIFFFSHNVFFPIKDKSLHFSYIYFFVCKPFHFGRVQNFVVQ